VLEANSTEPLEGVQAVIRGEGDNSTEASGLATLIDRLSQCLEMIRLQPLDSHWPEYTAAAVA
jgi:hypothetical protein